METQLDFQEQYQDKIFIKHIEIVDPYLNIGEYHVTRVESKNIVNILKLILNNEVFRITVSVGKKGHFNIYKTLGDYVATFSSVDCDTVLHYIDFSGLEEYKPGQEFDLLLYDF